jgi:hypothetical protein
LLPEPPPLEPQPATTANASAPIPAFSKLERRPDKAGGIVGGFLPAAFSSA